MNYCLFCGEITRPPSNVCGHCSAEDTEGIEVLSLEEAYLTEDPITRQDEVEQEVADLMESLTG